MEGEKVKAIIDLGSEMAAHEAKLLELKERLSELRRAVYDIIWDDPQYAFRSGWLSINWTNIRRGVSSRRERREE